MPDYSHDFLGPKNDEKVKDAPCLILLRASFENNAKFVPNDNSGFLKNFESSIKKLKIE